MDTSGLTHDEKLIFAEVTAAVTEVITKQRDELKLEYDAGVLDQEGLESAHADMFQSLGTLLHRYADQMAKSEHDGLAGVFSSWGNSYASRSSEINDAIKRGNGNEALGLSLDLYSSFANNNESIEFIDARVGGGAGTFLKSTWLVAGSIGKALDFKEAADQYFDGDGKAASATLFGMVFAPLADIALDSVIAVAGLPWVLGLAVAGVVAAVGIGAKAMFSEVGTLLGFEDPSEAKDAVMLALGSSSDAALHNLGNHFFWGDQDDNPFVGLDDRPNDMAGMGGNDSLTGGAMGDFLNGGDDNDTLLAGC